jgi:transposase-like protein
MKELNVLALADKLRTEADAYEFLENLRWNGQPVCPHCGSVRKPYFLRPANGTSRETRTGSASQRRVWKCADCRKQFSVLTGTIFHGTKIPVRIWVMVIFEMCANKNGIAAREIERKYDVTPKSAWFMTHRIREAMKRDPMAGLLAGKVVADETWIGGDPKNRHGGAQRKDGGGRSRTKRPGVTDKTPVVSLISEETGEVRSVAVPNVTGTNLRRVMEGELDIPETELRTDAGTHYHRKATEGFKSHESVNHGKGEYVRGDVSTNLAEAYFSQLKRSIDGTHHHVSVEHLSRYLAEFDFRFSTRKVNDTERMTILATRFLGRRLTYRPVVVGA